MARHLSFDEQSITITFSGLTRLATLMSTLTIPYEKIRVVSIAPVKLPWWNARIGTSLGSIKHGRFWSQGKRYFVSKNTSSDVLVLELDHFEYDIVALELADAAAIEKRIQAERATTM